MMQHSASADRRSFLVSSGITALALGGLTACSGSDGAAPSATAPGSSDQPSSSAPSASAESSGSSTPSADTEPSGTKVALGDVPEGGGTILSDADFVVTQPSSGEYKAFSKICTHQGCPVSEIKDAQIVCYCHGSEFSIADGSVSKGPATQALPAATVTVSGDNLFVS